MGLQKIPHDPGASLVIRGVAPKRFDVRVVEKMRITLIPEDPMDVFRGLDLVIGDHPRIELIRPGVFAVGILDIVNDGLVDDVGF